MLTRIALLLSIVWLTRLVEPWLRVGGASFSARDLVLLGGGLFLLGKSVLEIHRSLEAPARTYGRPGLRRSLAPVVLQIAALDIVFSLVSVFRGGTGARAADHGRRHRGGDPGDDVGVGLHRRLHRAPPDHQDAGAVLPAADRAGAGRRGSALRDPEGISLLRDGVLGRGGADQHARAAPAGRPATLKCDGQRVHAALGAAPLRRDVRSGRRRWRPCAGSCAGSRKRRIRLRPQRSTAGVATTSPRPANTSCTRTPTHPLCR